MSSRSLSFFISSINARRSRTTALPSASDFVSSFSSLAASSLSNVASFLLLLLMELLTAEPAELVPGFGSGCLVSMERFISNSECEGVVDAVVSRESKIDGRAEAPLGSQPVVSTSAGIETSSEVIAVAVPRWFLLLLLVEDTDGENLGKGSSGASPPSVEAVPNDLQDERDALLSTASISGGNATALIVAVQLTLILKPSSEAVVLLSSMFLRLPPRRGAALSASAGALPPLLGGDRRTGDCPVERRSAVGATIAKHRCSPSKAAFATRVELPIFSKGGRPSLLLALPVVPAVVDGLGAMPLSFLSGLLVGATARLFPRERETGLSTWTVADSEACWLSDLILCGTCSSDTERLGGDRGMPFPFPSPAGGVGVTERCR